MTATKQKKQNNEGQSNLENVILVEWIESERGWGTRPDGYSLHLTKDDSNKYIAEYWNSMPDVTPDEYSRPEETVIVKVTNKLYNIIKEGENGIRVYNSKFSEYKKSGDLKI